MNRLLLVGCLFIAFHNSFAQEIVRENLGSSINTSFADTKPIISPDGKTLFFARQFHPDNTNGEKDAQDIYYSRYLNHQWTKAINIGSPLNDKYPNGVSAISPDGNTVLVLNAYDDNGVYNGVSISHRQGNFWSNPIKLNIKNYYNNNDFVDYYISNNEQELLLTIEREDAFGDQDLYVSFRIDEYNWTEPVNLGSHINTNKAEFSPFLAADNKTLFFASEGHGSYGGSDIYYSKRLDDTWQNWTDPLNLGPDINSDGFEAYYTIPASGDCAYYVSDKDGIDGSKDIFKATLHYQFNPEPVFLIKGHAINSKTHKSIEAEIKYHGIDVEGDNGTAKSEKYNGAYAIVLPRGTSYRYWPEAEGFYGISQYMDASKLEVYREVDNNLYLFPVEPGQHFPIHEIMFARTTDNFMPESSFELERFLKFLRDNTGVQIEITGYTNEFEVGQKNLILSESRASAFAKYLIEHGINKERLIYKGMGNRIYHVDYIKTFRKIDPINRLEIKILSTVWEPTSLTTQNAE